MCSLHFFYVRYISFVVYFPLRVGELTLPLNWAKDTTGSLLVVLSTYLTRKTYLYS